MGVSVARGVRKGHEARLTHSASRQSSSAGGNGEGFSVEPCLCAPRTADSPGASSGPTTPR